MQYFIGEQYYSGTIFLAGLLFSGVAEGSDEGYDQLSKACLLEVIMNFTFSYVKGVLNITFMPCFVGGNYKVILGKEGYYPQPKLVPNAKHRESTIYENIFKGSYNIKIMYNRVAYHPDPIALDAYKTEELDCRLWNSSISLSAVPNWHRIVVEFSLTPEHKLCFKNYTVELFRFDEKCQKEEGSLNKETALFNSTNVTVTFEDLSPGNYCAMVSAFDQNCLKETCGERTSQPIELSEKTNPVHSKNEKMNSIAIIVPLCTWAGFFIAGIIGTRCLKYYQQSLKNSHQQEHPRVTSGNETVTVAVLHAQCVKLQSEVAVAICDFLEHCCNVHPVIAEKDPGILRGSSAWIRRYFNYEQLLSERVIHKVLIVETDAAIRLYEHHWNHGKDHEVRLRYCKDSHLDDIFPRGLAELLSDPESCGSDHYRIIVVSFPYSTTALSCFKQKRLCLPHQTVELYNSVWNKQNLLCDEENLKNNWIKTEAYKRLLVTIEKMENYVRNNPNYLDNEIFEYTVTTQ